MIALGVAAEAPELVRALVLLDPAFKACAIPDWRTIDQYEWFAWVYDTIRSPRTRAEMVERCRSYTSDASEAEQQEFVTYILSLAPDAVQVWIEDREWKGTI